MLRRHYARDHIYTPDANPVNALYDLWHLMMSTQADLTMRHEGHLLTQENRHGDMYSRLNYDNTDAYMQGRYLATLYPQIGYGAQGYSVGITGFDRYQKPVFTFGRHGWQGGWFNRELIVDSTGRFNLGYQWGWAPRANLAKHIFLAQSHHTGSYIWFAKVQGEIPDLNNYRQQVAYLPEKLLIDKWFEIRGGALVLSPNQAPPGLPPSDKGYADWQAKIDKFAALREKRYLRRENERRKNADLPLLSVGSRKVTAKVSDEMVAEILAHVKLTSPARKINERLKEAVDGSDNLVADHTV